MAGSSTLVSGIAGRYATALFELSNESKAQGKVEDDLKALSAALDDSAELRDLISSPIYSRADQAGAIGAVATKMGLGDLAANTLRLMAQKRRLFTLPQVIEGFKALAADARGEVSADVTSAKAMTKAQQDALSATLKKTVDKDVAVNVTVDESLIGGLIVKVGSKMIDSSIRSKLMNLQNAMKEVG